MIKKHHLKKGFHFTVKWYLVSLIVISIVGGYIGMRGKKTPITVSPTSVYETVSFTSQATDQLKLEGWLFPADSKTAVIIVHGWGGNRSTFLELAEFIQKKNINVLTFDLRGGTGMNTYGQREAGDVASAVEYMVIEKKFERHNIGLIGNSMGGAASINYAAAQKIGALVLISSVIDLKHTKTFFARDLNLLFPSLYAAGTSFFERLVYGIWPPNPIDNFHTISAPTLIIHGDKDQKAPVKDVYALQKQLENEDGVTFTIVPNGEHTFLADDKTNRTAFYLEIVQFIEQSTQR